MQGAREASTCIQGGALSNCMATQLAAESLLTVFGSARLEQMSQGCCILQLAAELMLYLSGLAGHERGCEAAVLCSSLS